MNFRLGVYDLFSRIAPGGFYVVAFGEIARVLGWVQFDWVFLKDIGILLSLVVLLVAYIVGSGMDRIGSRWHLIFKKRGASNRALDRYKKSHSDRWIFDFEDKDWPILRAYIYRHNPNVAEDIDRFNALAIMQRNLSLGLALLFVGEVIQFANTGDWKIFALCVLLAFLSYQIGVQARSQRDMFYNGIFDTIMSYRLNLEERVKPVKTARKTNAK